MHTSSLPWAVSLPRPKRGAGSQAAYPVLQLRGELGLELAACATAVVSLNEYFPGHRRLLRPHGEDKTGHAEGSGDTNHGSDPWPGPRIPGRQPRRPIHRPRQPKASPATLPFTHAVTAGLWPLPLPRPRAPHSPVRPGKHEPASLALQLLSRHLHRHLRPAAKGLFPRPSTQLPT